MKGKILNAIIPMDFDPVKHIYSYLGNPLQSVSRILSDHEEPFDAEKISYFVARKELKEELGVENVEDELIQIRRVEVLQRWEDLRDDSADHGTFIHKIMERAVNDNIMPGNDVGYVKFFVDYVKSLYKEYWNEFAVGVPTYGVAGTMDFVGVRNTKQLIIDIDDFKTNKRKGITFDSIKHANGKIKHENRFLIGILQHLENCNYNKYCLQLSMYAYMLEIIIGAKIGRLTIDFISTDEDQMITGWNRIAVPYMRSDVILLLEEVKKKKPAFIEPSVEAVPLGDNW